MLKESITLIILHIADDVKRNFLTAVQEERGPRIRSNTLPNLHNSNATWKSRIDSTGNLCAHFDGSEMYLPFKNSTFTNAFMIKTRDKSEIGENVFFPVMSRHIQPTTIISPGITYISH